ncbi:hypothetical protein Glove_151g75 [Diversispora epigaea]|uniref:Uncharacterized protein n=1 Tax=Diversispora epigaea TaxID=1348612 RepID=A0A397IT48_9GLOM|nr:hypothetical protein Glove_151g75 [Diversispora epigaea]
MSSDKMYPECEKLLTPIKGGVSHACSSKHFQNDLINAKGLLKFIFKKFCFCINGIVKKSEQQKMMRKNTWKQLKGGDCIGQYKLRYCYLNGTRISKDEEKVFQRYLKSAE